MKIIDGNIHYTAKEVGLLVNRTHLTVHLWDAWSNELAERGDKRLIPEPIKIGKQKTRYWGEADIPSIKEFVKNMKRGDLAEFSQRQWSKNKETKNHKNNKSEKKMLKSIENKPELLLEEKLIYALFFILAKENDTKFVEVKSIASYLNLPTLTINQHLDSLVNYSLIGKTENKFILL